MRILPVSAQDRIEKDSLGEIRVAAGALWGAQTQRAVENFRIGRDRMPAELIRAIGLIKWAAAETNGELGELPAPLAAAIAAAALEIAAGGHADQFPLGVYQTGSGTSTNMNVNEVIAHLASRGLGQAVHANDHVNRCQSSNDVIPTAIHVAAALAVRDTLLPALTALAAAIGKKAAEVGDQVKPGRTHLMDALPITVGQEMAAWRSQVVDAVARIDTARTRLHRLALGATAVGTGVNAHPQFAARAIARLGARTGIAFTAAPDRFASLAAQDTSVELSGALRGAAVVLLKIANDLRWMNSGPLAGLGRDRVARLAARFQHHARQGQPGDPGSRRDGRHGSHRARCVGRHGGCGGQFPAQRHAAAHRRCLAREHRPARRFVGCARRARDSRASP